VHLSKGGKNGGSFSAFLEKNLKIIKERAYSPVSEDCEMKEEKVEINQKVEPKGRYTISTILF
jgi:hypothetical protein